jgi:hypothetical protein
MTFASISPRVVPDAAEGNPLETALGAFTHVSSSRPLTGLSLECAQLSRWRVAMAHRPVGDGAAEPYGHY